jgi:hypothetical protein
MFVMHNTGTTLSKQELYLHGIICPHCKPILIVYIINTFPEIHMYPALFEVLGVKFK